MIDFVHHIDLRIEERNNQEAPEVVGQIKRGSVWARRGAKAGLGITLVVGTMWAACIFAGVVLLFAALGAATRPRKRPSTTDLGLAGDPSPAILSILLGVAHLFLLAGAAMDYRRQALVICVLTTPIILAAGLWWIESP
jgi:hypothetical protein